MVDAAHSKCADFGLASSSLAACIHYFKDLLKDRNVLVGHILLFLVCTFPLSLEKFFLPESGAGQAITAARYKFLH